MPAWSKFKVGTPAAKGFNSACQKFGTVSHTSHIDSALSIIARGEIRPYLVFDESLLNDRRILVSWLSPNHWQNGYRYGNIRFDFDFQSLIAGKSFYWVEAIAYKIDACRILVTDRDHSASLTTYDPTTKSGPWWYDGATDQHYYNGNYCLEFMFEDAIPMKHLRTLDFVDHHSMYCSVHRTKPSRCGFLGFRGSRGGATFLARATAEGIDLKKLGRHFIRENGRPNAMLEWAFTDLLRVCSRKVEFDGKLKSTSELAPAVARGICAAFSFNQTHDAKQLASLFKSESDFDAAVAEAVSEVVGLEGWHHLVDA